MYVHFRDIFSSIKFTIKRPLPRHNSKVAENRERKRELKAKSETEAEAEAKANPKPELNPNAAHSL